MTKPDLVETVARAIDPTAWHWLDISPADHPAREATIRHQRGQAERAILALPGLAPAPVGEACGGCGETNPNKRCIGCLHPLAAPDLQAENERAKRLLSNLLECCRAKGGLSRQGWRERKAMDEATAFLAALSEPQAQEAAPNTFKVGGPAPYFCPACQAVPSAGYCNMKGCPTAPLTTEGGE
jgi:hypothetical protein